MLQTISLYYYLKKKKSKLLIPLRAPPPSILESSLWVHSLMLHYLLLLLPYGILSDWDTTDLTPPKAELTHVMFYSQSPVVSWQTCEGLLNNRWRIVMETATPFQHEYGFHGNPHKSETRNKLGVENWGIAHVLMELLSVYSFVHSP